MDKIFIYFILDDSAWKWTEEEKKSLSEMSAMSVIFMGEKNAGKSSLVNTILQVQSNL